MDNCPFVEPLVPLFWVSKPEWVLPYSHLAEAYVTCSLRSTSGATCADLLAASSTASHFPTCISRGGTWLRFEQVNTHTEGKCATIVPATGLFNYHAHFWRVYSHRLIDPSESHVMVLHLCSQNLIEPPLNQFMYISYLCVTTVIWWSMSRNNILIEWVYLSVSITLLFTNVFNLESVKSIAKSNFEVRLIGNIWIEFELREGEVTDISPIFTVCVQVEKPLYWFSINSTTAVWESLTYRFHSWVRWIPGRTNIDTD